MVKNQSKENPMEKGFKIKFSSLTNLIIKIIFPSFKVACDHFEKINKVKENFPSENKESHG